MCDSSLEKCSDCILREASGVPKTHHYTGGQQAESDYFGFFARVSQCNRNLSYGYLPIQYDQRE